ncbi:hypothetical protein GCM10027049_02380 [Mucilaginibacter puniceus]
MKNIKSKRLHKSLETVCDFNRGNTKAYSETTKPTETDPTTATVTIIITTVNTGHAGKMLI